MDALTRVVYRSSLRRCDHKPEMAMSVEQYIQELIAAGLTCLSGSVVLTGLTPDQRYRFDSLFVNCAHTMFDVFAMLLVGTANCNLPNAGADIQRSAAT